jgi:aminoglycoside phosphotransferase family enzyme/predicted kinase
VAPPVAAALAEPDFYPHQPASVEIRETHASVVFLAGELAYKLRKPVRFPFLDYSTPERRRASAGMEVFLNRRLAPSLYLGVRSVVRGASGALALGGEDADDALDWLVEMRRFDEDGTMAALLERGALREADSERVGRRLSDFHACAQRVPGPPAAAVERERAAAAESLDELGRLLGPDDPRAAGGRRFLAAALRARGDDLEARAAAGLVRDGHGDLRAEHVLPGDHVDVVDCVEFDHRLRALDVGADLAFLLMDLELRDGHRAGGAVLRGYRAAGGDPGDDALIALFAVMRAWVRAKIALLRGDRDEAERLLTLADRLRWHARGPLVLCIAGIAASGKSTLAGAVAGIAGVPVLSSDVMRKRSAGLEPTARAPASLYDPCVSEETYLSLGRAAAETVGGHGVVLVDATFRRATERAAFAEAFSGPREAVRFVMCTAPDDVLDARTIAREADPERVSDAGAEVARAQRREWEPLDEIPAHRRFALDTDQPLAAQVACVEARLDHGSTPL